MCSRAEATFYWERTSGLKADPAALKWWEMFASLKARHLDFGRRRSAGRQEHRSGQRLLGLVLPRSTIRSSPTGWRRTQHDPEATPFNLAAGKLLMEIAPNIAPGYGQGSASTVAIVMILAAQEYGRAADVRAWENARLREILARGGVAGRRRASGLAIAALNAENAALTRALIALQEKAEGPGGDKALEREIAAFLKESAARRRLHLPAM